MENFCENLPGRTKRQQKLKARGAYSGEAGHPFRTKPITDSGKPITDFSRGLLAANPHKMRESHQWTGTDAASPISYMARRLSIRCLRVVAVPHTLRKNQGVRYGAVLLDVYGPEQPGKISNTVRVVEVANDGGRWVFVQSGEPFPFEQVEQYQARKVRDRFTFEMLKDYLRHLGLAPQEPPATLENDLGAVVARAHR